jgi:hypothetical protein
VCAGRGGPKEARQKQADQKCRERNLPPQHAQ